MKRELKFKAWDKKRKLFVPISKLCTTTDNCRVNQILQTWSGKALSEHEYVLVQYTGLLDKNGKETYDGDLHMHEFESDGENLISYSPIVWDNGAFWIDESFKKDGSLLTLLCEFDEPLNIAGNKFENPELL